MTGCLDRVARDRRPDPIPPGPADPPPSGRTARPAQPTGLPQPRGPISERVIGELSRAPHDRSWSPPPAEPDEDDLHLALYCCYELHYQGFAGVRPEWEWNPSLIGYRAHLERAFLGDLRTGIEPRAAGSVHDVVSDLWLLATASTGPSLSEWVSDNGTARHMREFVVHRSAYQLKEADPHTWAIPRISGQAKATMVAIQTDEYGNGDAAGMHAALFADTMAELGLDTTPNRYLDRLPGVTLATTNLISMFGLHRRWRGALVGHLALFEMTSVRPMARYAATLRRLGLSAAARRFYDVHVAADGEHQHLAADGMVGGLLADDPELASDVLFGAAALQLVEGRFARHLLDHWTSGSCSLRLHPPEARRGGARRPTTTTRVGPPARTGAQRPGRMGDMSDIGREAEQDLEKDPQLKKDAEQEAETEGKKLEGDLKKDL